MRNDAAEAAKRGLDFTISRPFNWICSRMDVVPAVDGPLDTVHRVLACFNNNLLHGEPLRLVDVGQCQRTFCYINDPIEALLLMIENPKQANEQIFNAGSPNKEIPVKELAELMRAIYATVSAESASNMSTVDVSSLDFYGAGYDDSDKRIPGFTIINRQLGWNPSTTLQELVEITLKYQHQRFQVHQKATFSSSFLSSCFLLTD